MITTLDQFYLAIEQMGRLQRILESYRQHVLAENPRTFLVLAEGPLEQMRQIQSQMDDFLARQKTTPAEVAKEEAIISKEREKGA
jgi:hypothetical protein